MSMNTRKDNNGKALAEWKKLGVGHVARPLRYVKKNFWINATQKATDIASAQVLNDDGSMLQIMALLLANGHCKE